MDALQSPQRPSLFKGGPILTELTIALLPWVFLAIIYKELPAQVAVHFNAEGIADHYATKESWEVLCLPSVGFIGFIIGRFIRFMCMLSGRFDKKFCNAKPLERFCTYTELFSVSLLSGTALYLLQSCRASLETMNIELLLRIFVAAISILFILVGNLCPKIRPNKWFGIKTPRAFSSPNAWNKVQSVGGRLMFWCGVFNLLIACVPFIPTGIVVTCSCITMVLMLFAIFLYRPKM